MNFIIGHAFKIFSKKVILSTSLEYLFKLKLQKVKKIELYRYFVTDIKDS